MNPKSARLEAKSEIISVLRAHRDDLMDSDTEPQVIAYYDKLTSVIIKRLQK